MKTSKNLTIIILTGALGMAAGIWAAPIISGDNIYEQVRKFNDVLNLTSKNYVENVDTQKLTESAIKGMLGELDPHSVYISADAMKKVTEDFRGSFDGIGVEYDIVKDTITVVTPISGGPSESLGIQSGDKIVKIDNVSAIGLTRDEVPKKLRGPKGSVVRVTVKRSGVSGLTDYDITRDKIPIYTVDASFILQGTDIGLISINRFAENTHREFIEVARRLREQGMKKLILDLRGNPGGYLDQARQLADEFLPTGEKIVFTKARRDDLSEEYFATAAGEFEKIPLIILVNAGSASASEIMSGAVQDLDRGLIVGETSFGKGLVQQQFSLGDGSAFRLTISKYYTPSGRLIQRPYGDKSKYYKGEGREEGEEGDNLEHESDITTADSNHPKFKTKSGRTVYGGGGITPDYIVKSDTITPLSRRLRSKNIFWAWTEAYLAGAGSSLRSQYGADFDKFRQKFTIADEQIASFKKLADEKESEWNYADFDKDKIYITTMMRAYIARAIWGNTAFYPIAFEIDKQTAKAVTLFPEAAKIARLQ
ncbi:S41 family peptidase [Ignavibacteria bacterium]|nr:S41 family peptidase [Bacteroidota bacterium]MCZ2133081.1 S41 family peptidase [Bacteroidota bacterium]